MSDAKNLVLSRQEYFKTMHNDITQATALVGEIMGTINPMKKAERAAELVTIEVNLWSSAYALLVSMENRLNALENGAAHNGE